MPDRYNNKIQKYPSQGPDAEYQIPIQPWTEVQHQLKISAQKTSSFPSNEKKGSLSIH